MIEYLINELCADGMRHVKIVSDSPDALLNFPIEGARIERKSDELLGLHYVEVWWACRGFVDFHFEGLPKGFRRLAVWKFAQGERASEIINCLVEWFFVQTHHHPQFAWMKQLPSGVENGIEVHGVTLLQADWALPGCVLIGG